MLKTKGRMQYTPGLDGQCRRILQKSQRTGKVSGLWCDETVCQATHAQTHMDMQPSTEQPFRKDAEKKTEHMTN